MKWSNRIVCKIPHDAAPLLACAYQVHDDLTVLTDRQCVRVLEFQACKLNRLEAVPGASIRVSQSDLASVDRHYDVRIRDL